MNPDVIIVAILIATAILLLVTGVAPKLKKYRVVVKKIAPRKKRTQSSKAKRRKTIQIKVL